MPQKPQISILHIASGDLWAGAEVMLAELAIQQQQSGTVMVSVVLMNSGRLHDTLQSAGIDVRVLDESKLNGLRIYSQLRQLMKQLKPDLVHTHRKKENILGSIAAFFSHIPSIRTTHGANEHKAHICQLKKYIPQFMDKICGNLLQKKIVAVSQELEAVLKQQYRPGKLVTINNGINPSPYHKLQKNRSDSSAVTHIGFAGRLTDVKRVDLLLLAASQIKQPNTKQASSSHNIQFHIYGDGPLMGKLKALAKQEHLESTVAFEGHCDNINNALKQLDIIMLTSDHEGLPMILLEAMSSGVHVIAHATGGITELLDNGRCGTLVNDHSATGYAEAITSTLDQPDEMKLQTMAAQQQIHDKYSIKQTAEQYLKLYHETLMD